MHAFNMRYGPTATEFEIPSFKFHIEPGRRTECPQRPGGRRLRQTLRFEESQIQSAFDTFKGIKRRMEVRGIAGGVTVVDDFGHHPTAIRETLRALRIKYPHQKLWAIFEPRTNTTRRNVFQNELAIRFADADAVVVAQVARLELLAPDERLDPEQLMQDLKKSGKAAAYLPDVGTIVDHVRLKRAGRRGYRGIQQWRIRGYPRASAFRPGAQVSRANLRVILKERWAISWHASSSNIGGFVLV